MDVIVVANGLAAVEADLGGGEMEPGFEVRLYEDLFDTRRAGE